MHVEFILPNKSQEVTWFQRFAQFYRNLRTRRTNTPMNDHVRWCIVFLGAVAPTEIPALNAAKIQYVFSSAEEPWAVTTAPVDFILYWDLRIAPFPTDFSPSDLRFDCINLAWNPQTKDYPHRLKSPVEMYLQGILGVPTRIRTAADFQKAAESIDVPRHILPKAWTCSPPQKSPVPRCLAPRRFNPATGLYA